MTIHRLCQCELRDDRELDLCDWLDSLLTAIGLNRYFCVMRICGKYVFCFIAHRDRIKSLLFALRGFKYYRKWFVCATPRSVRFKQDSLNRFAVCRGQTILRFDRGQPSQQPTFRCISRRHLSEVEVSHPGNSSVYQVANDG